MAQDLKTDKSQLRKLDWSYASLQYNQKAALRQQQKKRPKKDKQTKANKALWSL